MQGVNLLSTLVALGILSLIAIISIAAIMRYKAEEALKILGVLSGLFGVVTGTFVTYFFTREPITIATQRAEVAETRATTAELKLANLAANATTLLADFNALPDQTSVADVRKNSELVKHFTYALNPGSYYEGAAATDSGYATQKPQKNTEMPAPKEKKDPAGPGRN